MTLEKIMYCDTFECRSYFDLNYRGLEDSDYFTDWSDAEDWAWEKLQNGCSVIINGEDDFGDRYSFRFSPDVVGDIADAQSIEDFFDNYLEESKKVNKGRRVNESADKDDLDYLLGTTLQFISDFSGLDAMEEDWLLYVEDGEYDADEFTDPEDCPDLAHPVGDGYYVTKWFSDSIREQLEDKDFDLLDQIIDYIDFYKDEGEDYDKNIYDVVKYLGGNVVDESMNESKKIDEKYYNSSSDSITLGQLIYGGGLSFNTLLTLNNRRGDLITETTAKKVPEDLLNTIVYEITAVDKNHLMLKLDTAWDVEDIEDSYGYDVDESVNETMFGRRESRSGGPIALDYSDEEEAKISASEVAKRAAESAMEQPKEAKCDGDEECEVANPDDEM